MSNLVDCYGNAYEIVKMPPNGLCGYHSLSYCLSGDPWRSYNSIIEDCINVFRNIPELYRMRTNFGGRRESSLTLADYVVFMQNSVQRVHAGLSVTTDVFCEDGHLACMSLLYDIAICVYSQQHKQWYVFNEEATCGYILLLNTPGHFDVLKGTVPPAAHTHAVSRRSLGASDEAWQGLQRRYTFDFVHAFPSEFTGINILNNPVVHVTSGTVTNDVRACDFPGKYIAKNVEGRAMHKITVHEEDCSCDFPSYSYSNSKGQSVLLQGTKQHSQQPVDSEICQNVSHSGNVELADVSNVEDVVNSVAGGSELQVDSHGFCTVASRKVLRKRVSSTAELHMQRKRTCLPSTTHAVNIDLSNRFSELHDDDDRDTVISCHATDAHNEVNSVASMETNDSRKSKRLANNGNGNRVESLSCAVQKPGRYTCNHCGCVFKKSRGLAVHISKSHGTDVENLSQADQKEVGYACDHCGSVCKTPQGLVLHKRSFHGSKLRADYSISVDVEPDDDVRSMQSQAVSVNKHNASRVESLLEPDQKEVRYACVDCGSVFKNFKALSMHRQRKRHTSTVMAGDTMNVQVELDDDVRSMQSQAVSMNKHKASRVETLPEADEKKLCYKCEDCGSVIKTLRGLAVHRGKLHKSTLRASDAMSVEMQQDNDNKSVCSQAVSISTVDSMNCDVRKTARLVNKNQVTNVSQSKAKATLNNEPVVSAATCRKRKPSDETQTDTADNLNFDNRTGSKRWRQCKATNTRQDNVKTSFSEQIAELEKEFLPRKKVMPQTDPLYDKLKAYHDSLLRSVSNTTTEKLSAEVLDVILNPTLIDDADRRFVWSKDDENRLNDLNQTSKLIQPRAEWKWSAADDTDQGQYNDKRMQLCITKECQWKVVECNMCGSTGLLVGYQIDSEICYDCMKLKRVNEKERTQKQEAWEKVKPKTKDFPKTADGITDLPKLQPGDKAVIAPVHAVVTLTKNSYGDKRMRLESISLVQDPVPTWCRLLPRTSLADRYMVIEKRVKTDMKYIVANADRVREWLRYLFLNHGEFIRLRRQNQLAIDEAAIETLGPQLELAEVDSSLAEHSASEAEQIQERFRDQDDGLTDATVESGFSDNHVFSFDRYDALYLRSKDVLRIKKQGKMEIVEDHTVRKPTYSTSANLAFPHLYPHGEMSPLDFGDYKLGRYLLKKQALFAHRMSNGRLQWNFAEDDIHMAHLYSRVCEQTVRANVGYYLASHPSVAHVPLQSILTAFRDGVDQDSGLLDAHLPDLTTVMSQLPNSRQKWFCERLGIEALSRDVGSPNLFVTINLDPRASPDVRRLLYKLEHGEDMDRDEPFVKDTAEFTKLVNKFAPFVAVYLYRKVKAITRCFFTKICGIPEKETKEDWMQKDVTEQSYWWGRAEFNSSRGFPHFHCLVRLPFVLETALLGRIIHNGRVVRQEMKCGNIKAEKREQAWHMIEMGLLASRYAALFAHSISTASFYSEDVGIDDHQDDKVIRLEDCRKEFAKNYKDGNISLNTHPIMRRFDDPECHDNPFHEEALVSSVSCLHQCIRASCGGDPLTGDGCRFDFPKKLLKHTVPAVMQVNANQMETHILLRRTCDRVANLNRYFVRYLRSNHDVKPLLDAAHSIRYCAKYCAKPGKHGELLDEMVDYLNKRSTDLLPPNMKQVLTHLLLADCSHRAFISKQELAYKMMNLPDVMKSFANVDVVGFYKRANVQVPYDDELTIEYSDRTEYSAYAERCRDDTELGRGLTREFVENMCMNEFAETVQHKWINSKEADTKVIDGTRKRKFRTRDVNTGHWRLTLFSKRRHTRPSTVLYTAPAIDYEFVDHEKTTTQTTFYDLSIEKRHQLYRAYFELVMYVPWKHTPDETLLSAEVRSVLEDSERHAEIDSRHSLQRLEEFCKVYKKYYDDGTVAPPGSAWQRDNQFSYSMFLVNQHNRDIHLDRVDNRGVLKAQYEDVDELVNVDVDIRPAVNDLSDVSEYPTFENFMPPDTFRDIMEQKAPSVSEISVAFPMQSKWQRLEEIATHNKSKRFIANPPASPVDYENMTAIQQFAVNLGKDEKQQIVFLCGQAGSGKTAVALKVCEYFRGTTQCTAYTGKAASLFNGPTIHSLFGWSHNEHKSVSTEIRPDSKKVTEFRVDHEDINLFVVEEALAIQPGYFALMDEMMTAAFNPKHEKNADGEIPPFGGKKMLFLGDQAQLPPIGGPAVYDDGRTVTDCLKKKRESKQSKRTKTGQLIFEKYLVPNCIYLQRGQRNMGLLGEICYRMRQGTLTEDDCTMLTYQRTRFPDVCTDFGIHYQNEMCSMHNWRQLWNECTHSTTTRRMYICKATYHMTTDNSQIVDALSALPPQAYDYAPDILCIAEGCEVRLLHNVNTAAGLVTSQSGTVVKVIFNNADAKLLVAGEHVVPYCIVVSFAAFQGFVDKRNGSETRIFPFPNQRTWVPVYRKRFSVKISSLPKWVRKKQLEKQCYRIQFPLDLASNVTAHRAQGQTMANCLVSVDLGLEHPDMKMPPEISALLYVACTRVTKLENLFVRAIHPSVWQKIGQSDADKHRRNVDEKLRKAAVEFAQKHGMHQEMLDELAWTTNSNANAEEWRLMQEQTEPPPTNRVTQSRPTSQHSVKESDFEVDLGDVQFSMFSRPVLIERHIGIDQGVKNFAIVVVERTIGTNPNIVAAQNYTELKLKTPFKAADVVIALTKHTELLSWMNPEYGDNAVDRVVVHLEQIDLRNRNSKQMSAELGRLLQQQAIDPNKCIVQMSSPHVHRANGPLFHLGDDIAETLQLQPVTYLQHRSRAESNPSVVGVQHADVQSEPSDVEPSNEATADCAEKSVSHVYHVKKRTSAAVFRYIITADQEQQQQMKLTVENKVQKYWLEKIASHSSVKLDDVGDALLHALDEVLCGSSQFKQLVPAAPSVHVNRTVAIAVFPETTYWVVLNCRWNTFVFENFGYFTSRLRDAYYKDPSTVDAIKQNMVDCDDLWIALSSFEGNETYDAVEHIKVVVKQLTGHTDLGMKNEEAGALTDATTKAMKLICDGVIGTNSKLCDRRDRILGSMYCRTSTLHHCDRKFQVINSTGKHTNAVLSCLSWMKQNLRDFVEHRREMLSETEKRSFFCAMVDLAHSGERCMEMIQLSDTVRMKLCGDMVKVQIECDKTFARNIADLVLISLSKNLNHIKAIKANSLKSSRDVKPATAELEEDSDVEP